ncbi:hypothetical protein MTR67_045911 [Solanum verrucosum]|uniref:ubiquitinyl hydrolase 1 n=1 Tax=Solanum verrucosum TaxID=315347 RepID=A0AAF0UWW3_SOLVR|nr:hypothetical protein MTR67_045911 [Solanum verrucosum]
MEGMAETRNTTNLPEEVNKGEKINLCLEDEADERKEVCNEIQTERVHWVIPKTTKGMLNSWKGIGRRESEEDWWEMIPACIWWTLWKERNARDANRDNLPSLFVAGHISFLFQHVRASEEEVAKELGIPVQFQRFWIWAKRQNHTYRPNRPLSPQEELQTVGQLREVSNKTTNAELKLFLEVDCGLDLIPVPPPDKSKDDILLFFKLYDPEKEELRYVGRLFVKSTSKPIEILPKLNELAGFAPDQEIELFEEIKFEPSVMCERLDRKASFRFSQIEDGDIICFQKKASPEVEEQVRFPDVSSYMEYVKNRQIVHFRALEKPKEDDFCLELAKGDTYDEVVERVAQRLGVDDSSKIRLTPHNCYSQQPKPNPIKYRSVDHLVDMLIHYNQISDILYYEVLDIPLPELQCLKTLKVAFHHSTKDEIEILNVRLPKQSTVGDVLNEIKSKVELSHPNAELRLLEVFYHKIYKIPEEEKNLGPHDRLIHVYHFTKETPQNQMQVQNFGEPFFLVIREGETLAEIKVRIQKKLQVSDEEFSKWKFAFLSLGRPEYLQDSDIVSNRFQRRDVYGAWEQYLGLEHADNTSKRPYINQAKGQTKMTQVLTALGTTQCDATCTHVYGLGSLKDIISGFVLRYKGMWYDVGDPSILTQRSWVVIRGYGREFDNLSCL